tara:strand:- start:1502 stop:1756 length:255 start_codon:yes stop_codon:yes gene_type:complete
MFLSNSTILYLILFFIFIFVFVLKQESRPTLQPDNSGYRKINKRFYITITLITLIFLLAANENYQNKEKFKKQNPSIIKEINNA